jgi:hypothetical protein
MGASGEHMGKQNVFPLPAANNPCAADVKEVHQKQSGNGTSGYSMARYEAAGALRVQMADLFDEAKRK